ncbi:MAG: phosphonate ABC transporter substrate-binding protein [Burkholderiaceae bacterium]
MSKTLIAAALLAGLASTQTFAAESINFGIISTESTANLKQAWEPFLADMRKGTGLEIKAFFAPDYAGIIEGMRFNKVQVAWYGNKSAMEAVDRANGEIFAQTIAPDGSNGYYSLLVVHKDSPINSLDDVLANKAKLQLGFGDPNSTSGTLVPGYYAFALNNVDPAKDFKRMVRANHETNLLAVSTKQVDVATNNTENWGRFEKTHPEKIAQLRQVWKSPLIPSDPLVWRVDLDPKIKAKMSDFLLAYGKTDAREKQVLLNIGFAGFKPSNDDQLIPVRQISLVKEKTKLLNNDKVAEADKATRIAEIDKQLAELAKRSIKD